jgi:hypothetical protein
VRAAREVRFNKKKKGLAALLEGYGATLTFHSSSAERQLTTPIVPVRGGCGAIASNTTHTHTHTQGISTGSAGTSAKGGAGSHGVAGGMA